jgi:hypothetical protein
VLWIAKGEEIMSWDEVREKTKVKLSPDSFRKLFRDLEASNVEVHETEAKISGDIRLPSERFFKTLGWTGQNWLRGLTMQSRPGAVRFEATVNGEPLSLRGLFQVVKELR